MMVDRIPDLLLPAIEHFRVFGYWAAFLAAAIETTLGIGLLLPGSTIILLLGALSAGGHLDPGDVLWFAVAGAVLGDNINYALGRKYGTEWTRRGVWLLRPEHFEKARSFFDAHGARSVFLGRFVPTVKEIMPFIAGSVRMHRRTFMLWNVLGAIGWGCEWVGAGYLFAQSLNVASLWLSRAGFFLAVLFLLLALGSLLRFFVVKYGPAMFHFTASILASMRAALRENPEVMKLVRRHPVVIRVLGARVDRGSFTGLPLTLFGLAFVYMLLLFGGIVEDFLTGDPIIAADARIADLLSAFRTPAFTRVALWITMLGTWRVVLSFAAAAVVALRLMKKRGYTIPLLTALLSSVLLTFLGKIAFHRDRPPFPVYTEHSFSFPSGHATVAVAFYGFVTYILIRNAHGWRTKVNFFSAGVALAVSIGFTRLYLGVHYLSDVWSGYLIGALGLIAGIALSEWMRLRDEGRPAAQPSRQNRRGAAMAVLASFIISAGIALYFMPEPAGSEDRPGAAIVTDMADIFTNEHLKYAETITGAAEEPINIVVAARDDRQFSEMFQVAGWLPADRIGLRSLARLARTALFDEPYHTAPITPLFWNDQANDLGFQKSTASDSVRRRHHVRFWRTGFVTAANMRIYAGSASFDAGLKWGVTHRISSNIDAEREYLFEDLESTGMLQGARKIRLSEPTLGKTFSGDQYFTDGSTYFLVAR